MNLTLAVIRDLLPKSDVEKGMEYERRGAVISQTEAVQDGIPKVLSKVQGTKLYDVSFYQGSETAFYAKCSCVQFETNGRCKHIAAAMIHYTSKPQQQQTSYQSRNVLEAYLHMSQPEELENGEPVQLVPRMDAPRSYDGDGYPIVSFRVGREQLYSVKHIRNFLKNVLQRDTVSYGKKLTFNHGIEHFTPQAQKIIRLMMNQYREFRALTEPSNWYSEDYGRSKNEISFTGHDFDQLFDLLKGETILYDGSLITLQDGDPNLKLSVKVTAKGISINVTGDFGPFFGHTNCLYVITSTAILRCSDSFRRDVYPMLSECSSMQISAGDMPTFCTCVLPRLREHMAISDPKKVLEIYLPHDCTPCFYFDIDEDDVLVLRLRFRYGEEEIEPAADTPNIRRNRALEQNTAAYAERYFRTAGSGFYFLLEADYCAFLVEKLDAFREQGEVFLSDRLHRRQLPAKTVNLGLSVSDGLLTLDLDTGEFPPQELEALYQSLLRKTKYYRLSDGRYLTLDGSGLEKMAEMAHMLQLSPKDLAKGTVTVPAFRAMYLDTLTADSEGIRVTRDRQFRQMIRNFKSVSESDYQVPEHLEDTLRSYQKTGFRWLKTLESAHFGGILADEMGLGKTLQVITYLCSLETELQSLVICPASLILNWGEEFARFAPDCPVQLVLGTAAQRKKLIDEAEDAKVIVTSYELLRQDLAQYQDKEFYCCILDEAQHIKNQSTQISKAVKQVNCRQRFVLTGTPIENRLSELWNLFDFLMPGYLFSHTTFLQKLEKPIIKSGNQEAAAQLQRLVQPFLLRRLKKDVLKELPPKMEYVRPVPLTEEERKVYAAAVNAAASTIGSGSKLKILAALTQLRQICCDPHLCFENYAGGSSKLEACLELVSGMVENGHQVLLFSQFTSMLDILRPRLDAMGISNFTLQGSTPKETRAQLVKSFNAGEASVFLISLKAGGTGLNLTAADVVIHYDPWWNLAAQNQATDRAHRIGQQASVQVYKLITKGTIEEKILQLQDKKAALMELVSEDTNGGILEMSTDELLQLLQYQGE